MSCALRPLDPYTLRPLHLSSFICFSLSCSLLQLFISPCANCTTCGYGTYCTCEKFVHVLNLPHDIMSRYVLGLVFLFYGSITITPLFLILSLFYLVHFVLELVSVFVVIYVFPVPISSFVVFFVLVSPSLFVCNCEVLFLCKGRRYVCHIFHVINLPHDNLYAQR